MTMQIRRYQDSDRDQVLRLHKAALEAVGAYVGNGPWDDDLNDIKRSYLNARGEFLVGIADGQSLQWVACDRSMSAQQNSNGCEWRSNCKDKDSVGSSCRPWKPAPANSATATWSWTQATDKQLPGPSTIRRLSPEWNPRTRRLADPVLP